MSRRSQPQALYSEPFREKVSAYFDVLAQASQAVGAQVNFSDQEQDPILPLKLRELCREIFGQDDPWQNDPIGDIAQLKAPRLTHRYPNRALLHIGSQCAVHCRFCFRKNHLAHQEDELYGNGLEAAFEYLTKTPQVREVILTGGDPLTLSNLKISEIFNALAQIPSVRIVRIHSRLASALPRRLIDEGFCETLKNFLPHFRISLVNHFNCREEVTPEAIQALNQLQSIGVTLLNQAVLLRGVNDSSEQVKNLFQYLYEETGTTALYLHHPDLVRGTLHFRRNIKDGMGIYDGLRGKLSGPALPQYVLDLPTSYGATGAGKVPLTSSFVQLQEDLGEFVLTEGPEVWRGKRIIASIYEMKSPLREPSPQNETDPNSHFGSFSSKKYLDLACLPE